MVLKVGDRVRLDSNWTTGRIGVVVRFFYSNIQVRWLRSDGFDTYTYSKNTVFKKITHYDTKLGKILYGD